MTHPDNPWYSHGLRFTCTQCGHCCRVQGHVWVDVEDIRRLAHHLGLDVDGLGLRFLRRIGNRMSLLDKPNQDCVFWENGCSVYPVRPRQCRTFPFWESTLESPGTWTETARECEGIGAGDLYSLAEIESLLNGHGATKESQKADQSPDDYSTSSLASKR